MSGRVNIFNFATGELTNDAMICWLVSLGNDNRREYRELAKDVINLFVKTEIKDIKKVETVQQYNKIDVLIKVNDDELIIVEDKVNTGQHNNQLENYMQIIEESTDEDIIKRNKNYVYLKIGNESMYQNDIIWYEDKDKLVNKKYLNISRKMLLDVLNKHKNLDNDILNDYIDYLEQKEELFNRYKVGDILDEWSWGWEGYFTELQEAKVIKHKCWGYVSNSTGGFLGFWWNNLEKDYKVNNDESVPYNVYLQIEACPWKLGEENVRVTFKVTCENDNYKSIIRNYVWDKLKVLLDKENDFNKTNFKKGTWMTIAEKRCLERDELEKNIARAESLILDLYNELEVN